MSTKFNKSQIFSSAWSIVRSTGKTISQALKSAWAIAKNAGKNILTTAAAKFGVVLPETIYETGSVVGKVWEKDGKVRLYVRALFAKSSPADCGYIDLISGKSFLQSTPRGIAQRIESMTQIIAK
ncbi:hypothetical protein [Spirosoma foliorum]|uniref:Uncharacterized protein n=1 Tax=Spirosoma foliorum TaxID=2710596 RepID=A0A7G5H2F3_9BACT|nr:hypothetical protein [Spirosoma foliorum]QMW05295.1 hypothetical protein H3H32_10620 [Spirosoma foliorum]